MGQGVLAFEDFVGNDFLILFSGILDVVCFAWVWGLEGDGMPLVRKQTLKSADAEVLVDAILFGL